MIERCAVLDDTFSDTDRYPSLIEFEVHSLDCAQCRGKGLGDAYTTMFGRIFSTPEGIESVGCWWDAAGRIYI